MLCGAASRCTSSTSSTGRRRRLHSHGSESGLQRPKVPLKSVSDRSSRRLRPGQTIHACQPSRSKGLKALLFSVRNSGFPGKRSGYQCGTLGFLGGFWGCDPKHSCFRCGSRCGHIRFTQCDSRALRTTSGKHTGRAIMATVCTSFVLVLRTSGVRNGSANRLYKQLVPPSTDI